MIKFRKPWGRQPQSSDLRIASRWASRVTFASVGGSDRNIAADAFDTRSYAFDVAGTAAGLALNPTTTAGRYIVAPATNTQDFTLLSVIVPQSVAGNQQIASRDDSRTSSLRHFQFRTNGAAVELIKFNTATSAFTASIANAAAIGRVLAVVGVSAGTAIRVFCNGAIGAATLTGTSQTWSVSTAAESRWFERDAGSAVDHGSHFSILRVIMPVGISDAEAHSLSLNPWQLFQSRRIFIPQAGIVGLPTLSAATYVPGSLTASGFRPRVTAS